MKNQIEIHLNGVRQQISDQTTITQLLDDLGLKRERIAIEINREIVRREEWEGRRLGEHDQVEIVHFVGGGSR